MAVIVTDNRTIRDEADATTGWTGTTALFTTDPTPVEATGELGATVGAAIFDAYHTAASADISNHVIYCWVFSRLALGNTTDANGGLMIYVGDVTNAGAWKVAGADKASFRHDNGPTGWQCPALDTTNLPASPLSRSGSAASVNFSTITRVGTTVNSLVAAPGMSPTYLVDIIRILNTTVNNGCALTVTGGTSGDPGTFLQIVTEDRSTANQKAHGVIRELAVGAYGCQAPLRFGNPTGTNSSWFEDSNVVFVFENRGFRTTLYKIFITDNGVGTTTFRLKNSSLIAPPGVGAEFDAATDTDVDDVILDACRIEGFTSGVKLKTGLECINSIVTLSGQVVANGADMRSTQILLSTVATDNSALVWDVNIDTDGLLDNTRFSKGTNAHHAIELGVTSPTEVTLRGISSTGFNAANGQNDSTIYIKRTTGTVTINLVGTSGNFSYKTDGATVVLVIDPVTLSINCKDTSGNNIQDVRVLVTAATGGDYAFQDTVTITRSGSTASVSHTAHGMVNGDKVVIYGATQNEYNGIKTISNVTANAYDFTVSGTPATPATGIITSTTVLISGLTDINGTITNTRSYTSSQPIGGRVRKSTVSPYYKTGIITGTVSNTTGASIVITMLSDE